MKSKKKGGNRRDGKGEAKRSEKDGGGENLEFHTILINAADTLNATRLPLSRLASVVLVALYFRIFLNSKFL